MIVNVEEYFLGGSVNAILYEGKGLVELVGYLTAVGELFPEHFDKGCGSD